MSIEAMKQALEALEKFRYHLANNYEINAAIAHPLRQAIAEAEKQEPVAQCCAAGIAHDCHAGEGCRIVNRIKAAYPQPKREQGEPVAITITGKLGNIYSFTGDYSLKKGDNVYTTPYILCSCGTAEGRQQRKPLTFEQVEDCFPEGTSVFEDPYGDKQTSPRWLHAFARAIEAAHGIKGEA